MKTSSSLFGWIVPVALVISGCGGGGGGGGELKPPISSVSSSSQSSSVISSSSTAVSTSSQSSQASSSSAPVSGVLALEGTVAAVAMAGGEVVFTIGSKTYSTPIDNTMKYSLVLDVPAEDTNKPFVAVATGAAGSSRAQLAALYPSVSVLEEKAGSDMILTADEFPGVNISTLTTAEYAEVKNNNLAYDSDAQRKNALLTLQPVRAVEQAAMIGRLLTSTTIPLPSETDTTLDYLLNASVAEAHLEAFRILDNITLESMVNNLQTNSALAQVSSANFVGRYVLEMESSQYFLTINENNTGRLQTASIDSDILTPGQLAKISAAFTWQRTGRTINLQLSDQVSYKVPGFTDVKGVNYSCDEQNSAQIELCNLRFQSVQLELVSESDLRTIANVKVNVEATRETNQSAVYQGAIFSRVARLINARDFAVVTSSELVGGEWISANYRYVFNTNGQVERTSLITKATDNLSWSLENSRLAVGNSEFWITHRTGAGFSIFVVEDEKVQRDGLIKRATVSMVDEDWVGRWSSFPADKNSNSHDIHADKSWRDGFEAKAAGNWAVLNPHSQTALANANQRIVRDVLATHNGKYFLSICEGVDAEPFAPSNCYLSTEVKSNNFTSTTFWNDSSFPAFNEKASGGVWLSLWSHIISSENATADLIGRPYTKVSGNKLFDFKQGTIYEMTSASQSEIEVCEYSLNSSCNNVNKRRYEIGVEVKLTIRPRGAVEYPLSFYSYFYNANPTFSRRVEKALMVPRNRGHILKIVTDSGQSSDIASVSGCGGTLMGLEYHIPPLVESCEVTVNLKTN